MGQGFRIAVCIVLMGGQLAHAASPLERDEAACAAGDPVACLSASLAYEQGRGVARDAAQAAAYGRRYVEALRGACARGQAPWCHHLGGLYERGERVGRDVAEARRYYQLACAGGYVVGCGAARRVGNAGL